MIEVTITKAGGTEELGRIRIENLEVHDDQTADYSVQFAVERCGAVGLHQRSIRHFPRTEANVLGLLLAALTTLEESELRLERGTAPSDMARRLRRSLPAFPREA